MNMDIFTGGQQREWQISEYLINGIDFIQLEECNKDDTVIFSKGDVTKEKPIPVYTWKKNSNKCSEVDEDLEQYFILAPDLSTITFYGFDVDIDLDNGVQWDVVKAESSEIIIELHGVANVQRLRFIPKSEML